jgi:hypothetical protein
MIRIDYEEFTIDVPIERRMTVEKFLAIADRLERIAGRAHLETREPVHETHWHAPAHASTHVSAPTHRVDHHDREAQHVFGGGHEHEANDFRFEHEDAERLEYFMDKLARQLEKLEETHSRLERIEGTLAKHGMHHH